MYVCGRGCQEGTDGSGKAVSGPWHRAGAPRGALYNEDRLNWDGICERHWPETSKSLGLNSRSGSRLRQAPASDSQHDGIDDRGGSGRSLPAPDPRAGDTVGTGPTRAPGLGKVRRMSRPSVAEELAKLAQAFDARRPLDTDRDAPLPPPRRQQRHVEATSQTVEAVVTAAVNDFATGMPLPRNDGTLKTFGSQPSRWSVRGGAVAYVPLGHPSHRADLCKGDGSWSEGSKLQAMNQFLVTGTIVYTVPEVSILAMNSSSPRDQYIARRHMMASCCPYLNYLVPTLLFNSTTYV